MPIKKSKTKSDKNQSVKNNKLIQDYIKIMKQTTIVVQSEHDWSNLRQPSLLEEVDSITTYEVSGSTQEYS